MPNNVFGNSNSDDNGSKIDTSLFVQKPYPRTNYIETNIEEDIDLENQLDLILLVLEKFVVKIMLIFYSTILV